MGRSSFITAMVLTIFAALIAFPVHADERYGEQKVVYDVDYPGGVDSKSHLGVLRNIQNHLDAVGVENVEIRVVLSGDGVDMLLEANSDLTLQGMISDLKNQNVVFLVCNNTLVNRDISVDDLFEVFEDDIVPAGVAELTHLQAEGYAYIKH